MSRCVATLIFAAAASLLAQDVPPQQPPSKSSNPSKTPELKRERPPQQTSDQEEVPPEEDKSLAHDEYTFNPLQSQRDLQVGDFYLKTRHDPKAAAFRYHEATLHNDGNALAWFKLGEASEKLKDSKAAIEAYKKYLELDSTSKPADEVRKRLAKLK